MRLQAEPPLRMRLDIGDRGGPRFIGFGAIHRANAESREAVKEGRVLYPVAFGGPSTPEVASMRRGEGRYGAVADSTCRVLRVFYGARAVAGLPRDACVRRAKPESPPRRAQLPVQRERSKRSTAIWAAHSRDMP